MLLCDWKRLLRLELLNWCTVGNKGSGSMMSSLSEMILCLEALDSFFCRVYIDKWNCCSIVDLLFSVLQRKLLTLDYSNVREGTFVIEDESCIVFHTVRFDV